MPGHARLIIAVAVLLACLAPAAAERESAMVAKFCVGMEVEYRFVDQTRVDCLSGTHAIEVDWSENWASAIGQSLHYSLWARETVGPYMRPGVILVCRKPRDTCLGHIRRIHRVADSFDLPLTLWDCDARDEFLSDCQRQELGGRAVPHPPFGSTGPGI